MTPEQKDKCHLIIHTAAVASAAGNLAPVPGTGLAADVVTATAMVAGLCLVFDGELTEQVARGLAVAALKDEMLKEPIKTLTKELSKLVPLLGQIVAPTLSIILIEAVGWKIAADLSQGASYGPLQQA